LGTQYTEEVKERKGVARKKGGGKPIFVGFGCYGRIVIDNKRSKRPPGEGKRQVGGREN